ncbi:hypothetical protein V8E55_002796, partial [Tylopilus felleus]
MSSELQSIATGIVDNNYVTLVILTAVGYDYILTLWDEIEYIWNKPWSWVSVLFVLVRYFGLCSVTYVGAFPNTYGVLTPQITLSDSVPSWGVPSYLVL